MSRPPCNFRRRGLPRRYCRQRRADRLGGSEHGGSDMQESTWVGITSMRSQAGSSLILPFVLMHGVVLVIIAFGGDALGDSSVQLAVAAIAVIGSMWTTLNFDGVFADFAALRKDMPDGVASSNFGAALQKLPIGPMRAMGIVFSALIVVAELLAIY